MPYLTIRGVPHLYDLTPTTQSRPTLVFIHGWLLSREYWQPLIAQLSDTYQCLSYDLRGFGQSNQIAVSSDGRTVEANMVYSPAAYAEDIGTLLQELNIHKAWIIGHSLGGAIALWSAAQFPDCIQGVTCLNSGGGIYLKEEFERFRAVGSQMIRFRARWLCYLPFLDLVFSRASVARPIERQWGKQRLLDFVTANSEAALRSLLDSTTEEEVHRLPQLVTQLQQPVYFITGTQDDVMEPRYVRHLASFHPLFNHSGDNVFELTDCGHLSMIEQTHRVAEHLKAILERHTNSNALKAPA